LERAEGPDRVEVTEEEEGLWSCVAWAEAGFEGIAKVRMAMNFDARAEGSGVGGSESDAGVDGCFAVGRRFDGDQLASEREQGGLLAAGTCEQGAHGNHRIELGGHLRFFRDQIAETL
jgi:hypothetical protein